MGPSERNGTKRGVSVSVILGTLLVPLSAYAASVLVFDGLGSEPEPAAAVSTTDPVTSTVPDIVADLDAACGPVGLTMVAAETEGSISEIQQVALDALREICDQEGRPLPAKPAVAPITETVVFVEAPGATVAARPASDDWGDDDDWDDDHDDEDDEDEHAEDDD
jgi:hypothetical protein